jgi:hypothetical protein
MTGYRQWAEVKPLVADKRKELLEALVSAPLDRVRELQIELRLLDELKHWFETRPATENRIGPPDGANPY